MTKIRIAGLDGSLRNFGISIMEYDLDTGEMSLIDLIIAKTAKSKIKTVRSSSDNLARSIAITNILKPALDSCAAVFVEVPSGGQSYSAVLGFGIVIGIYASLDLEPIEVSPGETKLAAVGTKTASKEEIVEWAMEKYPSSMWRTKTRKGITSPTADNEHIADGVAIAHAGVKLPVFLQTVQIMKAMAAANA